VGRGDARPQQGDQGERDDRGEGTSHVRKIS
jgi:hypothetical protein